MLLFEGLAQLDEALGTHHVDEAERPAGERREPEAENGADIALADVRENAFLKDAGGFQRLDHQEPLLELLHQGGTRIDLVDSEPLGLELLEPWPQTFLTGLRVVVEALAVLAPKPAALLDHFVEQ